MSYQKGISVVVCCYNSASRLPETIMRLAQQKVPESLSWEALIVNNASTDETSLCASNEWKKYNLPDVEFKVVDELEPGLSHARRKGICEAKFEFIIFCDDDNWLNDRYLSESYSILNSDDTIAAVGGPGTPVANVPFPPWFDSVQQAYAVGQQSDYSGDVTQKKHLWGAGLAFRKAAYQKAYMNFPSMLSDRKGKELTSGGDYEMCMRFVLMGYKLHYSDKLNFQHFIPAERLSLEYKERLFKGFALNTETFDKYYKVFDTVNATFMQKVTLLVKSVLGLITGRKSSNKNGIDTSKLNIYLLLNLNLGSIDQNIVQMNALRTKMN